MAAAAACGAGAGAGTWTGSSGGTGSGITGAGAATFVKTGAASAWRVPQNGQCTTRSGKLRPQAAWMQTSFTFSDTFQPFPGFTLLRSAAILPHASTATARPHSHPWT